MTESPDERLLGEQLAAAGCAIGMSKGGRLLRIDNRNCRQPLNPRLLLALLQCTRLQEVYLREVTGFLNENMPSIAALENLQVLDVEGSDLTDKALDQLAGCRKLQVLNARRTQITPARVAQLRKRMIATRIIS